MDATKDILQGKWHELKGQARQTFAKLTDDDVERMSGKMEELSGVLQQKYGYNKAKADTEINNWLKEADKKLHAKV
ncbi:MAG: CsbD family protein [Thermoflexales bacterium]|jgi:uncharacterized protein YjbJ (UPF0337 family)|nr:CsbD family protein [Thermoflexales bacterium]